MSFLARARNANEIRYARHRLGVAWASVREDTLSEAGANGGLYPLSSVSETLHERGSRWITKTVQPGATTRPRPRSLRSRPGGCRRRSVPRWQPSAGV